MLKFGSNIPHELFDQSRWLDDTIDESLPVLVHVWAMSCPACKSNMPDLQRLRDKYSAYGLQTIAVHIPRGEFDLNVEEVRQAAKDIGVIEPCAIDNEHKISDVFGVDAFPTYFLFDPEGKLRRHARGNFGVRMIEQALIRMFEDRQDSAQE